VAGTTWGTTLPLPSTTALLGLSIVLQAVQAPTAAPLGADLSNAVVATFGS